MYLHTQTGTSDCALVAIVANICLLFDGDPTAVVLDQKVLCLHFIKFLETNWIPGGGGLVLFPTLHTEHSMASGKNQ